MKKKIGYGIIIIVFVIFGIKIGMIKSNSSYYEEKLKEKTSVYVNGSSAPRGRIIDTNGKILVDNVGVKTIFYNKIKGISVEDELEIASVLAEILEIKPGNISALKTYYLATNNNGKDLITKDEYRLVEERKLDSKKINELKLERITDEMISYDDFTKKVAHIYALMNEGYIYSKKEILKDVSEEEYAKVIESSIPGVTGELTWERVYPYGETLKNIFGSIGKITKEMKDEYLKRGYELTDVVGISYLEMEYEEYLKGGKAKYLVEGDNTLTKVEEEVRGNDLVLSIDIDLQMKVDEILKDKILLGKKYANTEYYRESYALISDPYTGSIMAISGMRLNDDNSFTDISLNTINKSYTMGSAVKGATISVGYKYNLITPGKKITDSCVKLYYIPQKCSFKSLGKIDDLKALAYSSNYYQFMIAIGLTGNKYTPNMKLNATDEHFKIYRDMLASYGLGVKTEIDLPNEQTGIIGKTVADDLLLNLAIGQYDTYTPIQMLQYINSVATGTRLKLSLMKEISDGKKIIKTGELQKLNDVDLEPVYLERIKEGMRLVLSEGTGKIYVPQGLDFAGKTGTSESFLDSDGDGVVDVATITSTFAGFYPSEDPKYSLVVITPNISHNNGKNNTKYYGASKISKDIINYLNESI